MEGIIVIRDLRSGKNTRDTVTYKNSILMLCRLAVKRQTMLLVH